MHQGMLLLQQHIQVLRKNDLCVETGECQRGKNLQQSNWDHILITEDGCIHAGGLLQSLYNWRGETYNLSEIEMFLVDTCD